ncbi:hypothetical protein [Streptomyces sp. SJL17-1]|uniref:hypothetical protein n=1 Tax=Streptomyces sp. SJL17-1 TaxID=2967223 RepID=UPI0029673F58|nr:hypothetical protein [Streptomyces sp. SJL17-1]
MSAVPQAEEEPSYADEPAHDAAGTAAWADASPGTRAVWTVGGAVLIVGSVVLFLILRERLIDLGTGWRYVLALACGARFLLLPTGTYCVVRPLAPLTPAGVAAGPRWGPRRGPGCGAAAAAGPPPVSQSG